MRGVNEISVRDAALALEMRSMGIRWKWIAREFGVTDKQLINRVEYLKQNGIKGIKNERD